MADFYRVASNTLHMHGVMTFFADNVDLAEQITFAGVHCSLISMILEEGLKTRIC